jgi:hypothetical protein
VDVPNLLNFFQNVLRGADPNVRFNEAAQLTSMKALELVFLKWKRKYKLSDTGNNPSCCVCLEIFNEDEDIIELHCNPEFGHIFHVECITDWAKKQKTCPLCRTDFVKLIRKEQAAGVVQMPEEIKLENPDMQQRPPVAINIQYDPQVAEEVRRLGGVRGGNEQIENLNRIIVQEPQNVPDVPRRRSIVMGPASNINAVILPMIGQHSISIDSPRRSHQSNEVILDAPYGKLNLFLCNMINLTIENHGCGPSFN